MVINVNLERIIASSCRRKIIRVLWKHGGTNIMDLVRKVNSTYSQVNLNLQGLEKEDIIIEQRLDRLRMIKLNHENPKTVLLLKALKILNSSDN